MPQIAVIWGFGDRTAGLICPKIKNALFDWCKAKNFIFAAV
jgi:hypothetical protein